MDKQCQKVANGIKGELFKTFSNHEMPEAFVPPHKLAAKPHLEPQRTLSHEGCCQLRKHSSVIDDNTGMTQGHGVVSIMEP